MQQISPSNITTRNHVMPSNLTGATGVEGINSPILASGLQIGHPQSPQMPQLVLASGQLGQGIQGAQVLMPTPQGSIY